MNDIDRINIYKKLVSIKPFFEDVKKIKQRTAFPTGRRATLTRHAGALFEHDGVTGGAIQRQPRILLI